jgi:hypothetical protein
MVILIQVTWQKVQHTAVASAVMVVEAVKGELVPLHTTQAYKNDGGTAPLIHNLRNVCGQSHAPAASPLRNEPNTH